MRWCIPRFDRVCRGLGLRRSPERPGRGRSTTTGLVNAFTLDNGGEPVEARFIGGAVGRWVLFDQASGDRLGSLSDLLLEAGERFSEGEDDDNVYWIVERLSFFRTYRGMAMVQAETILEFSERIGGGGEEWRIGGETERALFHLEYSLPLLISRIQTYEDLYRAMKHPEKSKKVAAAAQDLELARRHLQRFVGLEDGEIEMAVEFWQVFEGDPRQTYEAIVAIRG